ncbi:hypothetical protein ACIRD3_38190 [Kitasatospora sp. NPDC093550]|uniref:hypothetical protein n=1 Tax=Kitasatospora sp. NPDC093550 TaxID=3364089 RepID=UPI0038217540
MEPADADMYFGKVLRDSPSGTRLGRSQALSTYFMFLELRHKVEIHRMTGRVVECPIDEMNRPRGARDAQLRIPPSEPEIRTLFTGWGGELSPWCPSVPERGAGTAGRCRRSYVKPTDSCDSCLAWGNFSGRLCPTCYMFGRGHDAAACTGCRRVQPLKWNYCRLCWCQARLSAKAVVGQPTDETDVRDRLAAVRHHQLFFVGMHYRRRPTPTFRTRGGRRGAPRKPPPAPAWHPDPGWQQLPLFAQIPRDYSRLALADADLTSPWLAWAKYLAHRLAETRGWGRNIRFAVNRGLALVLTGHVEGDVIRHTEIFTPLRALDLPVGHTVTVLDEMGIFEDDSEPSFERWLAKRLEGLAPGIRSEAERWTRVLHDGGPRSLPRREGTVWLYPNRVRPALLEWSNPSTTCVK